MPMPLSGLDIQRNLQTFADRWQSFTGTEKSEAQTFLNELFECYGHKRQDVGAKFEDFKSSAGFMDLHWPGICIVEMKKPGTPLASAREQVHRYRMESADEQAGIPAAKYVVICSFQEFEIWQPGDYPKNPRATVSLADLPARYDALNFLAGPNIEPSFLLHDREMTKDAAEKVALMYQSLADRSAAPGPDLARFVMQSVWCMFAEDLRMLQGWPFEKTVELLISDPTRNSAVELGFLFRVLNQKGKQNREGLLAGTAYVNGDLFANPAEVRLNQVELRLLREAVGFNWGQVDPTIFGSLMEGVLGDRRWELGAHYTHEVDIMKIVGPTIVQPWKKRIGELTSPDDARSLLDDLCAFKVLDPACGCGNFLYIAYRELRALEALLKTRMVELASEKGLAPPAGPLPFVPLTNMQGIELEPLAALIARVTLWMGHRQMIDLYGAAEDPLPLVTLSTIVAGADALRAPWPDTDCIIGNPPFLGAKHLRPQRGDEYVDWLVRSFRVGVKDYCVYWFRLAHEHLRQGQRAGLVGTNSISQTGGRTASLDYIVATGGTITDAISTQVWPGDAKVHVSLVNWIKGQTNEPVLLDGVEVESISSQLRPGADSSSSAVVLQANSGKAFAGVVPQAKGFILADDEARSLIGANPRLNDVVKPFLNGEDIATTVGSGPSRWVIDFRSRSLEEAAKYPAALDLVRARVRPERDESLNRAVEKRWWLHGRRVEQMRAAIDVLPRFAAAGSTGKRFLVSWQDPGTLPNNAVCIFAFSDDFSMGVLLSSAHVAWAWAQASTLKGDLRYTPSSVFMTFPWPDQASAAERGTVSEISARLTSLRSELCALHGIGLTRLYNSIEEGGYADLKRLHDQLDEAVVACYGWPKPVAKDRAELVRRLTVLNHSVAVGDVPYRPFV